MSNIMSPEEFKKKMKELQIKEELRGIYFDREEMHIAMDELMCEVLNSLGYEEGVEIFQNTYKWYA